MKTIQTLFIGLLLAFSATAFGEQTFVTPEHNGGYTIQTPQGQIPTYITPNYYDNYNNDNHDYDNDNDNHDNDNDDN